MLPFRHNLFLLFSLCSDLLYCSRGRFPYPLPLKPFRHLPRATVFSSTAAVQFLKSGHVKTTSATIRSPICVPSVPSHCCCFSPGAGSNPGWHSACQCPISLVSFTWSSSRPFSVFRAVDLLKQPGQLFCGRPPLPPRGGFARCPLMLRFWSRGPRFPGRTAACKKQEPPRWGRKVGTWEQAGS